MTGAFGEDKVALRSRQSRTVPGDRNIFGDVGFADRRNYRTRNLGAWHYRIDSAAPVPDTVDHFQWSRHRSAIGPVADVGDSQSCSPESARLGRRPDIGNG